MKKKSLHQLSLNKKKISNLDSHSVNGGLVASSGPTITVTTTTIRVSIRVCTTIFPEQL
ncbi:hypothetical protein [Ascidiimonas aurantiaca]|uniref:hypothetical protein n=1 Tax=Ascidiimonas aurantiaca TaxID=1685432 RepID=UPI0030EE52F1